jgi:hypothetical protein
MRQTRDWRQWIDENKGYFGSQYQDHLDLRHCHVNTGVIIGRRNELTHETSKRLMRMNQENHYDWIITYDALLERARMLKRIRMARLLTEPLYHTANTNGSSVKRAFVNSPREQGEQSSMVKWLRSEKN